MTLPRRGLLPLAPLHPPATPRPPWKSKSPDSGERPALEKSKPHLPFVAEPAPPPESRPHAEEFFDCPPGTAPAACAACLRRRSVPLPHPAPAAAAHRPPP